LNALEREKTRLVDAYQAEIIELAELAERRQRLTEQGQLLRARVQEIEQQRLDRAAELRLLEGVDAFCTSIRDAMVAPSFEVKQKVLQLVVQRIVVEDHRIIIEHVVPSGPLRLQPERHHLRASWGLIHQPHLQVGTRCGRVHSGPFSRVSGSRGMSHTRRARGTTGKGQHHRRRPQDTVDFTPHICKGNHGEGCPLGRRTKRQHR
jgi:hypothetical protein